MPSDFDERARLEFEWKPNTLALVRALLMLYDIRRYFDLAWGEHWHSMTPCDFVTLRAYGIDVRPAEPAVATPGALDGECVPEDQN